MTGRELIKLLQAIPEHEEMEITVSIRDGNTIRNVETYNWEDGQGDRLLIS